MHRHLAIQLCFGFCHFPPSQAIQSEESVCLNLLFVMQVISEEEVSFKVSLYSYSVCPLLLSVTLSSLYIYIFPLFL